MSKPFTVVEAADAEITAAIAWYESQQIGLGSELLDQLQATLHIIVEHPEIGAVIRRAKFPPDVRRVPLRRFPYFVVYREHDNHLELTALAHTSRRPGYWRKRGV